MTSALEPGKWTKRRWVYAIAGVLTLQLALVSVLVESARPILDRPPFATRVTLLADQKSGRLPTFVDPALFALPSLQGFSGAAWLRYPTLEHRTTDPVETAPGLKLDPETLGAGFSQYLVTNTIAPPLLVDEPLPSVLSVLRYSAGASGEPVAPVSRLRIEGGLAARMLVETMELRSWPDTEILSNTVIRASIDAAGRSFSATLLSRSGLVAADEYAIRFVEAARFKPLPPPAAGQPADRDRLTWGTLTFSWHTLPMLLTNAPSNRP